MSKPIPHVLAWMFVVASFSALAQRTVTGRLIDRDSRKPVVDAIVTVAGTDVKTRTNALGFFQLQADSTAELVIASLEYPPIHMAVPKGEKFQIELVKDPNLAVEQPAEFPGGMPAFYSYIGRNIEIPKEVRSGKVSGKVIIGFVVDSTGHVRPDQITIKQSLCVPCDESAIRVIRGSPKWIPGTQRGKPVNQQMFVPISFK